MSKRQRMFAKGYMGNCYAASEALYHILGGKSAGWTPMFIKAYGRKSKHGGHWFIQHKTGMIIDPSRKQYDYRDKPSYHLGRGTGFLTKRPSKRAKQLIQALTWRER